jgi:hypothetical protein
MWNQTFFLLYIINMIYKIRILFPKSYLYILN